MASLFNHHDFGSVLSVTLGLTSLLMYGYELEIMRGYDSALHDGDDGIGTNSKSWMPQKQDHNKREIWNVASQSLRECMVGDGDEYSIIPQKSTDINWNFYDYCSAGIIGDMYNYGIEDDEIFVNNPAGLIKDESKENWYDDSQFSHDVGPYREAANNWSGGFRYMLFKRFWFSTLTVVMVVFTFGFEIVTLVWRGFNKTKSEKLTDEINNIRKENMGWFSLRTNYMPLFSAQFFQRVTGVFCMFYLFMSLLAFGTMSRCLSPFMLNDELSGRPYAAPGDPFEGIDAEPGFWVSDHNSFTWLRWTELNVTAGTGRCTETEIGSNTWYQSTGVDPSHISVAITLTILVMMSPVFYVTLSTLRMNLTESETPTPATGLVQLLLYGIFTAILVMIAVSLNTYSVSDCHTLTDDPDKTPSWVDHITSDEEHESFEDSPSKMVILVLWCFFYGLTLMLVIFKRYEILKDQLNKMAALVQLVAWAFIIFTVIALLYFSKIIYETGTNVCDSPFRDDNGRQLYVAILSLMLIYNFAAVALGDVTDRIIQYAGKADLGHMLLN